MPGISKSREDVFPPEPLHPGTTFFWYVPCPQKPKRQLRCALVCFVASSSMVPRNRMQRCDAHGLTTYTLYILYCTEQSATLHTLHCITYILHTYIRTIHTSKRRSPVRSSRRRALTICGIRIRRARLESSRHRPDRSARQTELFFFFFFVFSFSTHQRFHMI